MLKMDRKARQRKEEPAMDCLISTHQPVTELVTQLLQITATQRIFVTVPPLGVSKTPTQCAKQRRTHSLTHIDWPKNRAGGPRR